MRRIVLCLAVAGASCGPAASAPTPTPPGPTATLPPAALSPAPTVAPAVVSPAPARRIVLSDVVIGASAPQSLLFQVSGENHLRAVSWDAATNGVLPGQLSPDAVWSQSPDGSRYVVDGIVYDRAGQRLGALPWQGKGQFAWARNGQLVCKAVPETPRTGAPMRLETAIPGQPPRVVATGYGTYSDNAGYVVLACDPGSDRAVVASFGQGLFAGHLWVFRLSTGALIRSADLGQGAAESWVAATDDGATTAESTRTGNGSTTTTLRRADDGMMLKALPDFEAHGFSSNGSLLIGFTGQARALIDWTSGRVVWTATGYPYGGFLSEPSGAHMAIAVGQASTLIDEDVYIVASDGSSVLLPKGLRTAFHY